MKIHAERQDKTTAKKGALTNEFRNGINITEATP